LTSLFGLPAVGSANPITVTLQEINASTGVAQGSAVVLTANPASGQVFFGPTTVGNFSVSQIVISNAENPGSFGNLQSLNFTATNNAVGTSVLRIAVSDQFFGTPSSGQAQLTSAPTGNFTFSQAGDFVMSTGYVDTTNQLNADSASVLAQGLNTSGGQAIASLNGIVNPETTNSPTQVATSNGAPANAVFVGGQNSPYFNAAAPFSLTNVIYLSLTTSSANNPARATINTSDVLSPVPEPTSAAMALLGCGVLGVGYLRRKLRKSVKAEPVS